MHPVAPVVVKRDHEAVETVYGRNQPQYHALPSLRLPDGRMLTRWKLSFLERLKVLFTGNVYLHVMTFNRKLQPVKVTAEPDEDFVGDVRSYKWTSLEREVVEEKSE